MVLVVLERHVAEFRLAHCAVLAADGEAAGPGLAGQHPVEQFQHSGLVPGIDEEVRRVLSQCLGGAVTEKVLGLRAPQDDPTLVIEHRRRDAQQIQQAAGCGGQLVSSA